MKYFLSILLILCAFVHVSATPQVVRSSTFSIKYKPKYKEGFRHFDYVNPDAPKTGRITLEALGSFDNFHAFASRGNRAAGCTDIYDDLMYGPDDELYVLYSLVAKEIEYPKDYTWVAFYIDPDARFSDGSEITAEDVVASTNLFKTKGIVGMRQYYQHIIEMKAISKYKAYFKFDISDIELVYQLATQPVFQKKFWKNRDFSEPQLDIPVGSGPYAITDYQMGSYVELTLREDYWAKDKPAKKGLNNFKKIRYDYYKDQNVAFEAFKSGEFDFYQETSAKNWATMYHGKNFDKGKIIKEKIIHEIPSGMRSFNFNNQRAPFNDRRVRIAFTLLFDFEWCNKVLFYNQYKRVRSFFQDTNYESHGLPSKEEVEILSKYKDKLPPDIFTKPYALPVTDGSGYNRDQIREALRLFNEAGFELKKGKLINSKTGKQLRVEFLEYSPLMARVITAYQRNLRKVGIDFRIRIVDTTQFINRLRKKDFDMVSFAYSTFYYPHNGLQQYFQSSHYESSYNTLALKDPVIDDLIDRIIQANTDEKKLTQLGRAFDRVILNNYYFIPTWYSNDFRIAYWNKFSRPDVRPKYSLGFDTWWYDSKKAEVLKK